ncbi:adenosylcobinamide-GDP ribazoletransferase [Desulfoscipio geothermicus]|uniref:Adenosylcobinamide-GDP ribazoletransferase n=1 Tax=Desulfoscipio geothermicus DSM 3669 TaxID=1121426 RepID=A0A1I6CPE9_9FIRM|nr:adenosylcobinamide-GDP ribazoletransferase [Desulfoscipio geothermicus]SFQ95044.1 cobalamin-5'-phosphate synthase [Desulfoscipio geothermicus DSM 3669]
MEFLIALQFLTRIPVSVKSNVGSKNIARSMAYFPPVGLLIGGLAAGIHHLLSFVLAGSVCDLIALAFLIIVTGNMHGDGLMDTVDGFFSGKPREKVLEIMHDSRVGAHGVMAGSLLLLAKFVLLGQVPAPLKSAALVLVPVLGRWAQVYAAALYPYVSRSTGTGSFASYVGTRELIAASVFTLGATMLLLGPLPGIVLAGAILAGTAALARFSRRRIGGITGDVLGAMNECAEVLGLFALALVPGVELLKF